MQVGDGTTSVVVLAGELLREAKRFLEDGLPPQMILKGYRKARRRVGERPTVRFSLLSVLPAAVSHLGVNPWANASGIAVSRAGRCEQFVVDSEGVSGCFDGF